MMIKETIYHRLIMLFTELVSKYLRFLSFIDRLIDDSPQIPIMFFGNNSMFMNNYGGLYGQGGAPNFASQYGYQDLS